MSAMTLCSRPSLAGTLSSNGRRDMPMARRTRSEMMALSRKMLLRRDFSSPGMILKGSSRISFS